MHQEARDGILSPDRAGESRTKGKLNNSTVMRTGHRADRTDSRLQWDRHELGSEIEGNINRQI